MTERGAGSWGNILGPTATDIADTIQDISKAEIDNIILRLMPNIPGKGQLQTEWRDE